MRGRWERLTSLIAVPVLLLGSASPDETFFRCRFDHVARATCCCRPDGPRSERANAASSACCCDIETYQLVQRAPQSSPALERPTAVIAILPLPFAEPLKPGVPTPAPVDQGDRHGPLIVLLTHSFRI